MPVRERCHNKELFGPWLLRQINDKRFEGVYWLDEDHTRFRLPWKHLNIRSVDEKDIAIFKAWAVHSGKYKSECEDLPTYKTNFRCALKAVCNKDRNKMFSELEDKSGDLRDPHKIFRFNSVPDDSSTVVDPSTASHSTTEETNFQNEMEHDDYRLRISPNVDRTTPFINMQELAVIEPLYCLWNSGENGAQKVFEILQDDCSQDIPRVNQVFRVAAHEPNFIAAEPYNNCHEQPFPNNDSQLFHEQCSQYQGYVNYRNGHINLPGDGRVFQQLPVCSQQQPAAPVCDFLETLIDEAQTCQYGFQQESSQIMMNNEATLHSSNYACNTNEEIRVTQSPQGNSPSTVTEQATDSQVPAVTLIPQASQIPKLTSWEVTVLYRGKAFPKQNVSAKFYINHTGCVPQSEAVDIVALPPITDTLDQLQIQYTDKILKSVGDGLVLDVSSHDCKLYATRMGNSRVYWGMSESLESRENVSRAKKLDRNVPTAIFDFNQFIQEWKDYKDHKRSSPDYTLYLAFGQSLFEPIKKALVLVKLVPNFCSFWHQVAQQQGASSLHNELLSLQISNGSSFNSFDGPCLMDLDLSDIPSLF
ncbi:interferon regulatory factor 7 [Mantella aurantiaca]